ncbi:MAG TPA: hypothetical protein VKG45_00530 [Actinomycetes bacterium]|nr:hypothetical protein [Actinomycetes bacterium]
MASVEVPERAFTHAFEREGLPAVCVKTGASAELLIPRRALHFPRWTWVLLPFGILPFLIARWFASRSVDGYLPFARAAFTRIRQAAIVRTVALVAGVLLVIAGPAAGSSALWWAGVGAWAVAAVAFALELAWSVGAFYLPEERRVLLTRVHERFAREATGRRPRLTVEWPDR